MSEPSTVSSNLLRAVQTSDQAAWVRLVDGFYPMVYSWCRLAGLGPEDAADACQEVFQRVATSIARFRRAGPGDTFRAWLRQITRRRLADYRRRQHRQPPATGGSDAVRLLDAVPEEPEPSSGQENDTGCLSGVLEVVRGEFEEQTWQAFWRVTVDLQPVATVAGTTVVQTVSPKAMQAAANLQLQETRAPILIFWASMLLRAAPAAWPNIRRRY